MLCQGFWLASKRFLYDILCFFLSVPPSGPIFLSSLCNVPRSSFAHRTPYVVNKIYCIGKRDLSGPTKHCNLINCGKWIQLFESAESGRMLISTFTTSPALILNDGSECSGIDIYLERSLVSIHLRVGIPAELHCNANRNQLVCNCVWEQNNCLLRRSVPDSKILKSKGCCMQVSYSQYPFIGN